MPNELESLRIESPDRKSWVEITPWTDDSGAYSAIRMAVSMDYGHSRFNGLNGDLHFFNAAEFSHDFDRFILDRSVMPTLHGTYDSLIGFRGHGLVVETIFCLGSAFCGGGLPVEEPRLRGRFAIHGDMLNALNDYFRALAKR